MQRRSARTWTAAFCCAAGVVLAAPMAAKQSHTQPHTPAEVEQEPHPLRMRVVGDHASVTPGSMFLLGVHLDMDDGWHTYWPGINDSGLPTEVDLDLPEGFEAGPIQWPVPSRYLAPGDILDHVYEQDVTLLIPIRVDESAVPGSVEVGVEARWLVCREGCIPGDGAGTLRLEVAREARPASKDDAALIKASLEQLPSPVLEHRGKLLVNRYQRMLTLRYMGAQKLAFYPHEDSAVPEDLIESCEVEHGLMQIKFKPGKPTVRGLLVAWPSPKDKGSEPGSDGAVQADPDHKVVNPKPIAIDFTFDLEHRPGGGQ